MDTFVSLYVEATVLEMKACLYCHSWAFAEQLHHQRPSGKCWESAPAPVRTVPALLLMSDSELRLCLASQGSAAAQVHRGEERGRSETRRSVPGCRQSGSVPTPRCGSDTQTTRQGSPEQERSSVDRCTPRP